MVWARYINFRATVNSIFEHVPSAMNASALAAKCLEAEAIASSKWFMAVAWIQIVLCASDVALLFVAVRMHLHVKRHFHRSLNVSVIEHATVAFGRNGARVVGQMRPFF